MTGVGPSFFLLFFFCVYEHRQERFVFFAAFGTHIQMLVDKWRDLVRILALNFGFHEFIEAGVHFAAGEFLLAGIFQHAQELQDNLIFEFRRIPLGIDRILNALNKIFQVHTKIMTINI